MSLDQYVARFENMPKFTIQAFNEAGTEATDWYEIIPKAIVADLVINEMNVGTQAQTITAEIQKWGRFVSLTRRVWELRERQYRVWRSQFYLDAIDKADKKPSDKIIEAQYRVDPEYAVKQIAVERAEEAFNATQAIYDAFKAKRDMLRVFSYRNGDTGAAQFAV